MPLDQNLYPLPSEKTLRDEFAMAALTGILAKIDPQIPVSGPERVAKWAYRFADEMLAARKG